MVFDPPGGGLGFNSSFTLVWDLLYELNICLAANVASNVSAGEPKSAFSPYFAPVLDLCLLDSFQVSLCIIVPSSLSPLRCAQAPHRPQAKVGSASEAAAVPFQPQER